MLMAIIILAVMFIWEQGNIIRESAAEDVALKDYIPQLAELRDDHSLPLYQTNVVFLVPDMAEGKVGRQFVSRFWTNSQKEHVYIVRTCGSDG